MNPPFSFVWNRTKSVFEDSSEIPAGAVLDDLSKCAERNPDVIVEVAHPSITKQVQGDTSGWGKPPLTLI